MTRGVEPCDECGGYYLHDESGWVVWQHESACPRLRRLERLAEWLDEHDEGDPAKRLLLLAAMARAAGDPEAAEHYENRARREDGSSYQ